MPLYRRMASGGCEAHAHEQPNHWYRSGPNQSHQGLQDPCGRYHNAEVSPGALTNPPLPLPTFYCTCLDCSTCTVLRQTTPATMKVSTQASTDLNCPERLCFHSEMHHAFHSPLYALFRIMESLITCMLLLLLLTRQQHLRSSTLALSSLFLTGNKEGGRG